MDFRGRSSRSSGGSSGGSGSIDRSWTSQLSKAERDISLSSQRLENAFKENINRNDSLQQVGNANANANANGPHVVPNPIKMIRRLTALEIAIGQLGQDCETISEKRKNIVQSVIDDQNQNVAKTMQILRMKNTGLSSRDQREISGDENWKHLSEELQVQLDLLSSPTSSR